jgi:hypothetical protein
MNNEPRKTFIKIYAAKALTPLIKEARRVKYTVTKTDLIATVTDPENNDALVFKAVLVNRALWGVTFSTAYWNDPMAQAPALAAV